MVCLMLQALRYELHSNTGSLFVLVEDNDTKLSAPAVSCFASAVPYVAVKCIQLGACVVSVNVKLL
jgi:hypothetical protein